MTSSIPHFRSVASEFLAKFDLLSPETISYRPKKAFCLDPVHESIVYLDRMIARLITPPLAKSSNKTILEDKFSGLIPDDKTEWRDEYWEAYENLIWEVQAGCILIDHGFIEVEALERMNSRGRRNCDFKACQGEELWCIEAKKIHFSDQQKATFERQRRTGNFEVHDVLTVAILPDKRQNPFFRKVRWTVAQATKQLRSSARLYKATGKLALLTIDLDGGSFAQEEETKQLLGGLCSELAHLGISLVIYKYHKSEAPIVGVLPPNAN